MKSIRLFEFNEQNKSCLLDITEDFYLDKFNELSNKAIKCIMLDDVYAGWIHTEIPSNPLYSGFIFIYINPQYRRSGIATAVYRMAEKEFLKVGCNWWSSYPEYDIADKFAMSVGFTYTNTNSYMIFNGTVSQAVYDDIRVCRPDDYPLAPDIWSAEYAEMHKRLGIPYVGKELSEEERKEQHSGFIQNINNYFVIEKNSKIVGVGTLFDDNSGIGSLAVDSRFGGNGYGTRLATFLTQECIRRGNSTPCLYCESGNDNAMHIYKKIGYNEQSRESIAVKV